MDHYYKPPEWRAEEIWKPCREVIDLGSFPCIFVKKNISRSLNSREFSRVFTAEGICFVFLLCSLKKKL